jgi:hypothetical protein
MKLTNQARRDIRRSLSDPRTPAALKGFCGKLWGEIGSVAFFNQGGLSFLREAIVAADFGAARGASLVRLVPEAEQCPDYELIFSDRTEHFEQVEADKKGHIKGKDYKYQAQLPKHTVLNVNLPNHEEVIEIVSRAACKKAKPYPAGTQLLIYLNLFRFPSDDDLLASFPDAVSEARPFFSAIWMTWQGVPHQVC